MEIRSKVFESRGDGAKFCHSHYFGYPVPYKAGQAVTSREKIIYSLRRFVRTTIAASGNENSKNRKK